MNAKLIIAAIILLMIAKKSKGTILVGEPYDGEFVPDPLPEEYPCNTCSHANNNIRDPLPPAGNPGMMYDVSGIKTKLPFIV